ncbi:hypothetical protein SVIOM342S_01382 [Streptomyces violaceorubidus]
MWNVGNESVLGLQNCSGGRRAGAPARRLHHLRQRRHQEDPRRRPDRPVLLHRRLGRRMAVYKKNAPDLDLYAVNSYDAVCDVRTAWEQGGYTKPYIVTESGPAGEWEVPDNTNGVPEKYADQAKAQGYTDAWDCVTGHRGVALGATLFHYGTKYDFGGIWFNLLPTGRKRLSYYAVKRAYGGDTSGDNTPPVVGGFGVEGDAGQGAGRQGPGPDRARHRPGRLPDRVRGAGQQQLHRPGQAVDHAPRHRPRRRTPQGHGPRPAGRVEAVRQGHRRQGKRGVETVSARVVPPAVDGTNVALRQTGHRVLLPARLRRLPCTAANAVDGRPNTRWASDWSDPQWVQVDLGTRTAFRHVQLYWRSLRQGLHRPDLRRRTKLAGAVHGDRRQQRACTTPSTSQVPAATSASTGPHAARVTATRCTSSAS